MKKIKLTKKVLMEDAYVKLVDNVVVKVSLVEDTLKVTENDVEVLSTLKLTEITKQYGQSGWSVDEVIEEDFIDDGVSIVDNLPRFLELEDGSIIDLDEEDKTDEVRELPDAWYEEETVESEDKIVSVDVENKTINTTNGTINCESKSRMFQIMAEDYGYTAGNIAKMCDAHYSFVFGVLKRLNLAGSNSTVERPQVETKSSQMIKLYENGMKPSQIAKELNAHPSHVYAVIGKYKKSIQK